MLIREWMTKDVVTVTTETSMLKASKLIKEHDIRRLPVVDAARKVVGIVSDWDIKDASPSKATTLDMHELYYLLSEIKVKDIMTPNPITVNHLDTVERVALLMQEQGIGALPVINDEGILEGIITDHDVFKVLVDITGVRHGGLQIALAVEDLPGSMRPIFDLIRTYNASLVTMLTSDSNVGENMRVVYLRIRPMERSEENNLVEAMKVQFNLLYWVREKVHEA